jgi:ATP-dependent protease HslVU (ClpYQ) peptidase subunit
MTTIAFDGRVLASDSAVTAGGYRLGFIEKIFRIETDDGKVSSVIGCAGSSFAVSTMVEWIKAGCVRADMPILNDGNDFCAIEVHCDGAAFELNHKFEQLPIKGPWAIGSGEVVALTAMRCGLDAVGAVNMACEIDVLSGGPVIAHDLKQVFGW